MIYYSKSNRRFIEIIKRIDKCPPEGRWFKITDEKVLETIIANSEEEATILKCPKTVAFIIKGNQDETTISSVKTNNIKKVAVELIKRDDVDHVIVTTNLEDREVICSAYDYTGKDSVITYFT